MARYTLRIPNNDYTPSFISKDGGYDQPAFAGSKSLFTRLGSLLILLHHQYSNQHCQSHFLLKSVISYDYLKDTVELSQRFGRARQKDSSLTLMSERKDRPLSALKDVKVRQERIIKQYQPFAEKHISQARKQSQADRERAAFSLLMDTVKCERNALEVLKIYAAKTKAVVKETLMDLESDKHFTCKYEYTSLTRTVAGMGKETTKQQARNASALGILTQLREMKNSSA